MDPSQCRQVTFSEWSEIDAFLALPATSTFYLQRKSNILLLEYYIAVSRIHISFFFCSKSQGSPVFEDPLGKMKYPSQVAVTVAALLVSTQPRQLGKEKRIFM